MKKYLIQILLIILLCTTSVHSQEFFTDIIVTSPNGLWTDSRAYTTLNDAVTKIGSEERTLVIASEQVVTNLTIPSNITLQFERDGSINNTGTLIINTKKIIAPDRSIFKGSGDITFTNGTILRSSWFPNLVTALNKTNGYYDYLTLEITEEYTITEDVAVGDKTVLKWSSPRNRITVNAGFTLSNVRYIEAGEYQIFAGDGDIDFLDGTILNLSWFKHLRAVTTWVESEEVTLEITKSSTLDYNNTIPSNISVKINKGAILDGIVTLTINGPLEAGPYKIFGSYLTVTGSPKCKEIYPYWWTNNDIPGTTDMTTAIQNAINLCSLSDPGTVNLRGGSHLISSTITLKRGATLVGEEPGWDGDYGTVIKLADGSDCDMINTQTTTFTQFTGLMNLGLDGNKIGQGAGTFHAINAYWWDIANNLKNLKISDVSGSGIYFNNAGTATGNVDVHKVIINRCDGGAVHVLGPVNSLSFYDSAFEGNGGETGSNFVVEDTNDISMINLINCRGELRATASGGGARHILMDNCNGSLLNIIGGHYPAYIYNYLESIKIITSTARINCVGVSWSDDSDVIINDDYVSKTLTFAQLTAKGRNLQWNINRFIPVTKTSTSPAFWNLIDDANNQLTITGNNSSPEGNIVALPGSLHIRTSAGSAGTLYQKISGATQAGWLPIGRDATISTFTDGDGTPSVIGATQFKTGNTNPTTITFFDGGIAGQEILVAFNDANTTIDFTDTNLRGNNRSDWTPSQYDHMKCFFDGSRWLCTVSNN